MKREIETALQNILDDKQSGSEELLEKLNLFLLHYHEYFDNLASLLQHLKNHFIQFQNIRRYLAALQKVSSNKISLNKFLNSFEVSSGIIFQKIFENALPFLSDKKAILTISKSKTILEILSRLVAKRKFQITICESRPQLEGRVLARKLIKQGIEVKVITEAQAAGFIQKVDCVIIGADNILKNGDVINKVGSLQLAILAKHFQKPFYVLATKEKFSAKKTFLQKEENPGEIWKVKSNKILIRNFYFEKIPKELVTKIITN